MGECLVSLQGIAMLLSEFCGDGASDNNNNDSSVHDNNNNNVVLSPDIVLTTRGIRTKINYIYA